MLPANLKHCAAESLQSCSTLCDPTDGSPPGSTIPGILQARTLEWVAISFSSAWKWKVKVKPLSRVRLLATPWTAAHQAPRSMGFSRQEYWSGVPLPSLSTETSHQKTSKNNKKSLGPDSFLVNATKHLKKYWHQSYSKILFWKSEEETLPNSSYKACIFALIPKPNKDTTRILKTGIPYR